MDTDHPVFQVAAPDYEDPPEDVFTEVVAEKGIAARCPFSQPQLRIVNGTFRQMARQTESRSSSASEEIIRLLVYLNDSASPDTEREVVMYAFGLLGRGEESMDAIAIRHNLSRQAFSKKVQKAQGEFHIQPRNGMRPVAQRKVYEQVQRERQATIWRDVSPSMRRPTRAEAKESAA